jgi:hypothetical protein
LQPDDPILRRGDLTIWKLKEMAEQGRVAELNELFSHGVSLSRVPIGYSAGTGAWILGASTKPVTEALDALLAEYWRGKIFFISRNPTKPHGLNRIKQYFLISDAPIVPMTAFTARLLDKHELVPDATGAVAICVGIEVGAISSATRLPHQAARSMI